MKVFISIPMNGYSEAVVREEQQKYLKELELDMRSSGRLADDDILELIDTVGHPEAPKDPSRLWYLGEAIKKLEEADLIFFVGDWYKARGCWTEFAAATAYGKKMIWASPDFGSDVDFRIVHSVIKEYINSQEVTNANEASDVSPSD